MHNEKMHILTHDMVYRKISMFSNILLEIKSNCCGMPTLHSAQCKGPHVNLAVHSFKLIQERCLNHTWQHCIFCSPAKQPLGLWHRNQFECELCVVYMYSGKTRVVWTWIHYVLRISWRSVVMSHHSSPSWSHFPYVTPAEVKSSTLWGCKKIGLWFTEAAWRVLGYPTVYLLAIFITFNMYVYILW